MTAVQLPHALQFESTLNRRTPGLHWEQVPRWVLLLSLAGYPLVAALSVGLGIPNRPASMVVRGVIVLLALAAIMKVALGHSLDSVKRAFWALWIVFWAAYLVRMSFDLLVVGSARNFPPLEYVGFGLGACLIPSLAAVCPRPVGAYSEAHRPLAVMALLGLVANGWVIFFMGGLSEVVSFSGLRAASEFLNPIYLGHLAVTLFLTCVWWLLRSPPPGVIRKLLLVVAILISLAALVASGSRGPTVSLVVCLTMLIVAERRRIRPLPFVISLAVVAAVASYFLVEIQSSFWFERLSAASFTDDTRSRLMTEAWELFGQSPFVGAGIDPLESYPHNLLIEAFMAGGFVTGLAFCGLLLTAGLACVRVWADCAQLSWIPMLYVQYLVGAMLSGALYNSWTFWVLMGAVVSVWQYIDEKPHLFRMEATAGSLQAT